MNVINSDLCFSAIGSAISSRHGGHVLGRVFVRGAWWADVTIWSTSSHIHSLPDRRPL